MSDITLSLADTATRLGAAAALGGLIGLERERLERAAGLRTHALVALSSALVMIVSTYGFADVLGDGRPTTLDPSRVAAQVVSGVGFLGAGVIIFRKNAVRGLTTAASVWSVAGLGLAAGGGLLTTAALATAIMLFIQAGLRPLERRFFDHHSPQQLILRVGRGDGRLAAVEAEVTRAGLDIRGLRMRPVRSGAEDRIEITLANLPLKRVSALLDGIRRIDGVRDVTYSLGVPRPGPGSRADDDDLGDDDTNDT